MKSHLYICVVFGVCVFKNSLSKEILSNIVTLSHGGQIQGHQLKSYKNNVFYSFQEIPYAIPPLGNLRFREATAAKPWKGILKTIKNTKICIQLNKNDSKETEDCLYLNVYTPTNPKFIRHLKPVYVFIHGGVFHQGDATFDSFGPQFFMDYGVILVTLNYRLGAFGFISTEDDVLPGNYGLKDQNLAMQWVQKNIQVFGGDPNKVTIGGQSAGAGSIGHHILSKRSKGLFRSAIQESGSPLNSKMFIRHPKYFAFQLGHSIDNSINKDSSSQELLQVLLNATAEKIKSSSNLPIPENLRNAIGNEANTVWNPVEEYLENGFVKGKMHDNFKNGVFNHVPLLIGFNSEEELHFDLDLLKTKTKYFDDNSVYLINGNLNIKKGNKVTAGTKLKKVYTDKTFEEDFPAFIRFVSDAKYTTGICRQVELQSKYTDVYFYQFSYDGELKSTTNFTGVGHTDELNYLFFNEFNKDSNSSLNGNFTKKEQLLNLWTSFIKHLNPLPIRDADFKESKWPKATPESLIYQNINDTLKVESNPRNYKEIREIYNELSEQSQYTY